MCKQFLVHALHSKLARFSQTLYFWPFLEFQNFQMLIIFPEVEIFPKFENRELQLNLYMSSPNFFICISQKLSFFCRILRKNSLAPAYKISLNPFITKIEKLILWCVTRWESKSTNLFSSIYFNTEKQWILKTFQVNIGLFFCALIFDFVRKFRNLQCFFSSVRALWLHVLLKENCPCSLSKIILLKEQRFVWCLIILLPEKNFFSIVDRSKV